MASSPGSRRPALDPDVPVVVTLKDYVDKQVESVDNRLTMRAENVSEHFRAVDKRIDGVESQAAAAVNGLRRELDGHKQEVMRGLSTLTVEIQDLRETNATKSGQFSAMQKLGVFVVGFVAVVAPVVTLVLQATQHHS